MTRLASRPLVVAAIIFIAVLTLIPSSEAASNPGFACIRCGDRGLSDLLLNILLFLPFGAALGYAGVTARRALVYGLLFSAAIEITQLGLPGRSPTLRDIVTNGAGAWLGALLVLNARGWFSRGTFAVPRLWTVTAVALMAVASTGWLLTPSPSEDDYYGQWAPQLRNLGHWSGQVHEVRAGQTTIPDGRFNSAQDERDVRTTTHPLRVVATAGNRPTRLAPIFAIADGGRRHLLMIFQEQDDLLVRTYRRSSLLGLDTPRLRFEGAMASIGAGESFVVELFRPFGTPTCLSINGQFECAERFGAGSIWSAFISSESLFGAPGVLLSALALFSLALPVGLLARTVPRAHAIGASAVLFIGVWIAASASGLAAPTPLESAAVLAALAIGWQAHRKFVQK